MLNETLERAPRLAEYITTMQKTGDVNEALYNAAEITTNFKRGGDVAKAANRYGVNFLNASIQGMDKMYRNIKGENGIKGYAQLAARATILGIAPALINALVYKDDDDYENLPEYIKEGYWLFNKDEDGVFSRIPQGRAVSVISTIARNMLEVGQSKKDVTTALKDTLSNTIEQSAPNNPFSNNIISPITQVINNKSWYGEDIVGSRLEDLPEAEQYDEKTDEFSKFLGEKLNVSPKKINYLLDQYGGGIADVLLPMGTPYAENNIIEDKFTTDSVMKNKNVSNFYDTLDEQTKLKNSSNSAEEDSLKYMYLNSVNSDMSDLYNQKREIENSETLSDEEKKSQAREIQKQINELAENGLSNYENINKNSNYATIGDQQYYKDSEGTWKKISDATSDVLKENNIKTDKDKNSYFEQKATLDQTSKKYKEKIENIVADEDSAQYKTQKEKLNQEKKEKIINTLTSNSKLSDKVKVALYKSYYSSDDDIDIAQKCNIDVDTYLNTTTQTFSADKKADGTTISGSKKKKVISYYNSLNISADQKAVLINLAGYKDYNKQVVSYVNGLDMSDSEKKKLLKQMNFTVNDNGSVTWKK